MLPNQKNIDYLKRHNIKIFFIYRDQVVSYAYWRQNDPGTIATKILENIMTEVKLIYNHHLTGTVADLYHTLMPWKDYSFVHTIQFEKLIGPEGGGAAEEQYQEIRDIAAFLGLSTHDQMIREIMKELWGESKENLPEGKSVTFRSGKIGSWKTHFSEQHKTIFKKVAGQLLIDLGYEASSDW